MGDKRDLCIMQLKTRGIKAVPEYECKYGRK